MKAAFYERPGPADEVLTLGEIATPTPGAGEVLVRVALSAVNPSDVKLRAGGRPGMSGLPWPQIVPHSDGSGVIEAVGEGVPASRIGERVWLWNAQWQRAFGSCAEYVALPSAQAVALPEAASLEDGACLGIPAMTAHACLFADAHPLGEDVLITGGAGAVSFYAIQLAKLAGARVLTTVSSDAKAALAREAGADEVINYRNDDVAQAVRDLTGSRGVARIVDLEFGVNIPVMADVIQTSGIIVGYGSAQIREPMIPFLNLMFKRVTIRTELVYLLPDAPRAQAIRDLNAHISDGLLRHRIAQAFGINDIAAAHRFVESGDKIGCALVAID